MTNPQRKLSKFIDFQQFHGLSVHKKIFPDRELKFPGSGNFLSGPEKSGIGKPQLANPTEKLLKIMPHITSATQINDPMSANHISTLAVKPLIYIQVDPELVHL